MLTKQSLANILFTRNSIHWYGGRDWDEGEKPDEFIREPMLFAPEKKMKCDLNG